MYRLLFFDESFLEFNPCKRLKINTYAWDGEHQPKYLVLRLSHNKYKSANELLDLKAKFMDKKLRSIFMFSEEGQHLEFTIPVNSDVQDIYFEEGDLVICYGDPTYMTW